MTHKINVSVASLQPSNFEGWATKQGGSWKSWKRRWFVIKDRKMWYFKSKTDTSAKGWIDLTPGTTVRDATEPNQKKKYQFILNSRGVKGAREFPIFVESETDLKGFLKAINQVLAGDKKQQPQQSSAASAPAPQPVAPQQPTTDSLPPPPVSLEAAVAAPTTTTPSAPVYSAPPVEEQSSLSFPSSTPGHKGIQAIDVARDVSDWLKNNQPEGVLDFLKIWMDSLASPSDLEQGEVVQLTLCISSNHKKLSWRVDGPQVALIQKMVDFFWNVGAPENEIDRLNDLGAEITPSFIGSWIDMSFDGGMDGGWFFPCETEMGIAKSAGDGEGSNGALDTLLRWTEQRGINAVVSVGRDMGATPPRQTEFKFKVIGTNQIKLTIIQEAVQTFNFPPLPPVLEEVLSNLGPTVGDVCVAVVTSTDGFVRFGVIISSPTASIMSKLLESVPDVDLNKHQFMLNSFGQPIAVEYSYLNSGFGFDVYKEGIDVHVHYNLGGIVA
ncbi:PH domain-containing protein [Entamoeba marina]